MEISREGISMCVVDQWLLRVVVVNMKRYYKWKAKKGRRIRKMKKEKKNKKKTGKETD